MLYNFRILQLSLICFLLLQTRQSINKNCVVKGHDMENKYIVKYVHLVFKIKDARLLPTLVDEVLFDKVKMIMLVSCT